MKCQTLKKYQLQFPWTQSDVLIAGSSKCLWHFCLKNVWNNYQNSCQLIFFWSIDHWSMMTTTPIQLCAVMAQTGHDVQLHILVVSYIKRPIMNKPCKSLWDQNYGSACKHSLSGEKKYNANIYRNIFIVQNSSRLSLLGTRFQVIENQVFKLGALGVTTIK